MKLFAHVVRMIEIHVEFNETSKISTKRRAEHLFRDLFIEINQIRIAETAVLVTICAKFNSTLANYSEYLSNLQIFVDILHSICDCNEQTHKIAVRYKDSTQYHIKSIKLLAITSKLCGTLWCVHSFFCCFVQSLVSARSRP